MDITAISDLHGFFPDLPGGDLLIVAGDLTASDDDEEYTAFEKWFKDQRYTKKIFIGGNHDNQLQNETFPLWIDGWSEYLCDSGTEFEGLKIWGSPWTPLFDGVNPRCTAFMLPEAEIKTKFARIPNDADILVTHGPPHGMLDLVGRDELIPQCVGSLSLMEAVSRIQPKLHVFGHIHEAYGQKKIRRWPPISELEIGKETKVNDTIFVNCSHVNEHYEPVNKPIRIVL